MGKSKLNVRFHNPNSEKDISKYVGQIFVKASVARLEAALVEVPVQKKSKHSKK